MAETRLRSRWRLGYWRRHPIFGVVVAGCWIAAFVALGISAASDARRLHEHGQEVVGTVVYLAERKSTMAVRFTAGDGRTVETSVSRPDPEPQIGDRIFIRYDPADPGRNSYRADDLPSGYTSLLLWTVVAVPGLIVLVQLYRTWGRWVDEAESWRHPGRPRADRRRSGRTRR